MSHILKDLRNLRAGDQILIKVTVNGNRIGEKSVVCCLPSKNDIVIHADEDIHQIVQYDLHPGDRVKWFDDRWKDGKVLAVNVDNSNPDNPKTWIWVEQSDSWIRQTILAESLTRL